MDHVNRTLQKPTATGSQSFPLPEHLATLLKPGYEPPEVWSDGALDLDSYLEGVATEQLIKLLHFQDWLTHKEIKRYESGDSSSVVKEELAIYSDAGFQVKEPEEPLPFAPLVYK